ncbi:Rieske (2Fe-2S) protein [Corynebacterium tapiri]|uniref:Rieske (2Fe-2S) protein n=1 Tax=Corynebacterium tapiri TaxID=1448266 RepID=A0A5C4U4S9_9CORY|nr:Rieske (2Fe-2S) protein [Corynebacterium tapiri]TNL96876.1 Rieske (2Fe-2S) protein [Corynebacterium tapiri]
MSEFSCNRRLFLLGTGTTLAGALLAACGSAPSEEVAKTDIPLGSAILVGDYIVARPDESKYVAYSRSCPHQHQTIDQVDGHKVRCSAHGSVFDLNDGSVVEGPAREALAPAKLKDAGDKLAVQA